MSKKIKKILILTTSVGGGITLPLATLSCNPSIVTYDKHNEKTAGYADQISKLADKTISLAGAWGDARKLDEKNFDKLAAVGVTDYIANDGIQARPGLKQGDIEVLQKLFIQLVKDSENNKDLQINDKSLFSIYSHSAYAALKDGAEIRYNIKGDKKAAYPKKLVAGNDYFEYDATKKEFKKVASAKEFKITFIPSTDPTKVAAATQKLKDYLNNNLKLDNIKIDTSADYNAAASALKAGTTDLAFLPVDTWAENAGDSSFILEAGRKVQIVDPYLATNQTWAPKFTAKDDETILIKAMNNYKKFNNGSLNINANAKPTNVAQGYPEALKNQIDSLNIPNGQNSYPPVTFYRGYIYANKESKIYELITDALAKYGTNWKLKWDDVKKYVNYGYTSTTSSSSYTYPEQWFIKHFDGFKSFATNVDN